MAIGSVLSINFREIAVRFFREVDSQRSHLSLNAPQSLPVLKGRIGTDQIYTRIWHLSKDGEIIAVIQLVHVVITYAVISLQFSVKEVSDHRQKSI